MKEQCAEVVVVDFLVRLPVLVGVRGPTVEQLGPTYSIAGGTSPSFGTVEGSFGEPYQSIGTEYYIQRR